MAQYAELLHAVDATADERRAALSPALASWVVQLALGRGAADTLRAPELRSMVGEMVALYRHGPPARELDRLLLEALGHRRLLVVRVPTRLPPVPLLAPPSEVVSAPPAPSDDPEDGLTLQLQVEVEEPITLTLDAEIDDPIALALAADPDGSEHPAPVEEPSAAALE